MTSWRASKLVATACGISSSLWTNRNGVPVTPISWPNLMFAETVSACWALRKQLSNASSSNPSTAVEQHVGPAAAIAKDDVVLVVGTDSLRALLHAGRRRGDAPGVREHRSVLLF